MKALQTSLPSLNTAVRRSFATIQEALVRGKVAFLIGAGADMLIAREFNSAGGHLPPSWINLISEIPPFPSFISKSSQNKSRATKLIESWPAETASLARWWTGDGPFQQAIARSLDDPKIICEIKKGIPDGTGTQALCRLLLKTNLIITPNYSSYLVHALRSYKPDVNIAVLDREDLPSLPFPQSEENPHTIFLIHLHGRCSARSFPVLDAWGYNILQYDDANYVDLLRRTFTDRAVITLGVSWSDPPLRSAAAFVQRTRPYLSKKHLVLYFLRPSEEKIFGDVAVRPDPKGMARYWSNAMRAAYGVDVLFVNNDTQRQVLQKLDSDKSAEDCARAAAYKRKLYEADRDTPRLLEVWEQIADLLDACGDYESPLQHRFLREFSGVDTPTSVAVADATHQLADKLLQFLRRSLLGGGKELVRTWCAAVRIERHLRHHLYLYRPKDESNIRQTIWQILWHKLPVSEWKSLPEQLKFDFLLGKHELKLNGINISKLKTNLGRFEERFSKALHVWSHAPGSHPPKDKVQQTKTLDGLQRLAVELLDIGWESLAAKVTCDHMHLLAILASTTGVTVDEPLAKTTVDQARHAAQISRSSGCFRRQVKADSIAAMWTLDPFESRIQILGNIRVVDETKSVEPGLLGGLGAALLACDLRAKARAGHPDKNLKDLAVEVFNEAGLHRDYIYDALKYWIPFTPSSIKQSMFNLAKEMGVRFIQR